MTDWAAWGTSIGTLVLAGATFSAVRSSSRSTRIAERALLAGMRPVLAASRPDDRSDQVQFADGRVFDVGSGLPLVHQEDSVIYLAIPLRNVGSGVAQLRGYHLEPESAEAVLGDPHGPARHRRGEAAPDPSLFAEQQRDIYVAPGDVGAWQSALRDPASELYTATSEAIRTGGRITVDVLYGDHEGGQPTVTRFVLLPGQDRRWRADVARYWSLERGERPTGSS